jgi:type III restriction enzyme
MKIELKEFQELAVQELFQKIKIAKTVAATGMPQAVILSSPTGSGKTITLISLIERILRGDEQTAGDRNAVFLWLSDSPELNEQSRDKFWQFSIFHSHDLPTIDANFDQDKFTPGKVYFLNTQKLGKEKLLVTKGDRRTYTIWETIKNTEADANLRFYLIIDEAHRGTAQSQRDRNAANSIMQKFILGSEGEIPPISLVIGMSATPQKFMDLIDVTKRIPLPVVINPADVRASGLLKDSIVLRHPTETQPSDWSLLQAATERWQSFGEQWREYAASQKIGTPVKPVFVVQVQDANRAETKVTQTDLSKVLEHIEAVTGRLNDGEIVHCFHDHGTIEEYGYKIPKAEASKIQYDGQIRIVLFKTSLTTGWDCPRAEVMFSFRAANDPTNIAQLVGRMVRTPLARRVESSEALNSVSLYLPYYDEKALKEIVNKLTNPDAEDGIAVAEVRIESEVAELSKDPAKAELFEVLSELPSYSIERIPKASKVSRLIKLARQLNLDGIDKDAWDEAKQLVVDTLKNDFERLKDSQDFIDTIEEKKEITVRAVTFDFSRQAENDGEIETLKATADNIENLFDLCAKSLGEGLHMEFWRQTVDEDEPLRAKLMLYLILQDDKARKHLETACGNRLEELFQKYGKEIRTLTTSAREKYRKIRRQAKDPEPVELIYPEAIEIKKGSIKFKDHLYADANGDFLTDLNGWEVDVLKEEMKRQGFVGWLRNIDRKQWALAIPYEVSGEFHPKYPDFLVLRKVDEKIIVDILEPHDITRANSDDIAKGLAKFAQKHGDFFGRIELIIFVGGRIKRLNMMDETTNEKIRKISSLQELNNLFEDI